ncbi:MAG TPA: HDIG domain-containing protein [Syntrophales bacterium]|nr:HDIG domain-containing protein [Syntrophales bacterium]
MNTLTRTDRGPAVLSEEKCLRLMGEMGMMAHIVNHSRQVCRVALFLAGELREKSVPLNTDLVRAAVLLHDITKTRSFRTGENHARTGAELLASLGYPEVGGIIGQHVRLESYFDGGLPGEAEIVNYADKRVLHERITSLEERMDYILTRYGKTPEDTLRIRDIREKTMALEKRLFRHLPFPPDQMTARMNGFLPSLTPRDAAEALP